MGSWKVEVVGAKYNGILDWTIPSPCLNVNVMSKLVSSLEDNKSREDGEIGPAIDMLGGSMSGTAGAEFVAVLPVA